MKSTEKVLQKTLKELEESAQQIISTQNYNRELRKIRLLEELIKEQLENENSRRSASSIR